MRRSILVVEDEESVRIPLRDRLEIAGFMVETAEDGVVAIEKAATLPFELIILDVLLPRRDGFDVCRDIRLAGLATPILMLSARTSAFDKVLGIKLGADDYVSKPFIAAELLARIEVLLRRLPLHNCSGTYQFRTIRVDLELGEVADGGNLIYLSTCETQLLLYFIERVGQIVSRTEILQTVWGCDNGTFATTVDVHVASLRLKLDRDSKTPRVIETISGACYRFAAFGLAAHDHGCDSFTR